MTTPSIELPWHYTPGQDPEQDVYPLYAVIDSNGYTVIGMTYISEVTAQFICQKHNETIPGYY